MSWYFILLYTTFYALSKSGSIPETMQTIAVRGQLKCAQKNVVNTIVTLVIDIRFVDEQVLAIARTNSTGWFELKANILSTDIIKPFFHVHIGQSSGIKCRQRYKQSIPYEFITKYDQPERWYDAGIINLQDICVKLPDETSCLNKNDLSFMTTESSEKDTNIIY
ncbi:Transthyretin-like family protein [Onchocerca flexuosa]|uniref:Transthyretin-like family protein n=2 Tax=Onchocerca flexuosa TaxID=387005 RepID=A0A183I052_9BILA|nr:Transthyretin-like family protein [Onchocerca flexuosa]VDP12945.1 unnamed protein product [Onchocerca flexuosa]